MIRTTRSLARKETGQARRQQQQRQMQRRHDTFAHLFEPVESRVLLSTYYVSTGGSDSAAGSSSAPWQTTQKAANVAKAGDTVIVMPGNYAGFNIANSGSAGNPITFEGQPGAVINSPVNFGGGVFGINASGKNYITIQGFTVKPQDPQGAWDDGIRIGGTPNAWSVGDVIQNNNVQMRVVNQSSNVDQLGIFTSWTDGLVVQNNNESGAWDSGIYVSNSAKNYKVLNNTVYNVGGNGIHNNGDAGQGGPGINTNALIQGNVIHHVSFGIGGQAISCDGLQNSVISNNLIYDAYSKGISLYVTNASDGSKNNVVVGNTVSVNSGGYVPLRITDNSTGNVVFDNIFQAPTANQAWIDANSSALSGSSFDYNVNTGVALIDGSKVGSAWQTGNGFDKHSKVSTSASALFVNASAGDFHLLSTSPAVGAGIGSLAGKSAPTTDLDGNARPTAGRYDAGAYQFVTAAPPFATLSGSTLTVAGTSGADTVHLSTSGSSVAVTLNGSQPLTFPTSSVSTVVVNGGGGQDVVDVDSTLAPSLQLTNAASHYTLNVTAGALTLGNDIGASTGGASLNASAGTTVQAASDEHLSALGVTGGSVKLAASPAYTLTVTGALSVLNGGTIDLGGGQMLVSDTATPVTTLQGYLKAGYDAGKWDGTGAINSSLVAADNAGTVKKYTLGYAVSGQLNVVPTIPSNMMLIRPTLFGDANLDGTVDNSDISALVAAGQYLNLDAAGSGSWATGDWNFDGNVDNSDISALIASGNYLSGQTYTLTLAGATPTTQATATATPTAATSTSASTASARRRTWRAWE